MRPGQRDGFISGEEVAGAAKILLVNPDGRFFLATRRGARVFRHPQIIEEQADISCELSHFLCDTVHSFGFDDSNGKTPESGDVLRAVASAYPASVFIIVPIDDVVTAILDAPVAAVDGQKTLRIGLVRGSARDTIGEVFGKFPGFFLCELPFDHESLSHMGEVEVIVEFGGGLDLSDFDPPMLSRGVINKIRVLSFSEVQLHVLKKSGLVGFDGEVVMGLAFLDHVAGDLALGQQGICGDILALDVDSIE